MEKYKFGKHSLFLVDTGRFTGYGRHVVKYKLVGDDEGVLHEGEDYFPSPQFENPVGRESASTLLSFLLEYYNSDCIVGGEVYDSFSNEYKKFLSEVVDEAFAWDWIEDVYPGFHDSGM